MISGHARISMEEDEELPRILSLILEDAPGGCPRRRFWNRPDPRGLHLLTSFMYRALLRR